MSMGELCFSTVGENIFCVVVIELYVCVLFHMCSIELLLFMIEYAYGYIFHCK